MTGHLYGEETLSMQIGLNADLFGLMRYMQMPGVDRLYCDDPRDVTAEKGCAAVVGYMRSERGGEALMIADGTEPQGTGDRAYHVRFRTKKTPSACLNGISTPVLKVSEDEYMVRVEPCSGVLIELTA